MLSCLTHPHWRKLPSTFFGSLLGTPNPRLWPVLFSLCPALADDFGWGRLTRAWPCAACVAAPSFSLSLSIVRWTGTSIARRLRNNCYKRKTKHTICLLSSPPPRAPPLHLQAPSSLCMYITCHAAQPHRNCQYVIGRFKSKPIVFMQCRPNSAYDWDVLSSMREAKVKYALYNVLFP